MSVVCINRRLSLLLSSPLLVNPTVDTKKPETDERNIPRKVLGDSQLDPVTTAESVVVVNRCRARSSYSVTVCLLDTLRLAA